MARDNDKKLQRPLPDVPDPYDMAAKRALNPKADEKNFIDDRGRLVCGARKKKGPGFCRSVAGMGTPHKGHGRCKFCGGLNTGPKSAEGKAKVAQNGRKHGFYSQVLRGTERGTYEDLLEKKAVSLMDEIFMLKAKILTYLDNWQKKYDEGGEAATRVWYKTGLDQERAYYHAGTADDKTLARALDQLRRLVDSHAKLTDVGSDDMMDTINKELKAASQGQVQISWGSSPAQKRQEKGAE